MFVKITHSRIELFWKVFKYFCVLKGVFAKNKGGYRLNAIKKRF